MVAAELVSLDKRSTYGNMAYSASGTTYLNSIYLFLYAFFFRLYCAMYLTLLLMLQDKTVLKNYFVKNYLHLSPQNYIYIQMFSCLALQEINVVKTDFFGSKKVL